MAVNGGDADGGRERVRVGTLGPEASVAAAAGVAPPTSSRFFKRTFASLEDRNFRFLWFGMLFQMCGMQMQSVVLGWFVYNLTDSISLLGVVMAVNGLPTLIFGPIGGVLADRFDKKRVVQIGHTTSMSLVLFLAISVTTNTITWWHLLAAAAVHGSVLPFMMPARQSMIPLVVSKGRLMNAVALNSMGMQIMGVLAPGLGGGIIALVGVSTAYYLLVGVYAGAIFFTSFLPKLEEERRRDMGMASQFVEGIRYMRMNTAIMLLLVLGLTQTVLGMPIRLVLPVFAEDIFSVGPGGLGIMLSGMGVGSVIGAVFLASLRSVRRRGLILAGSGVLSGSVLVCFAAMAHFSPIYALALGFMVLIGLMQTGRFTLQNALILEYTDPQYRGRMISINMMGWGLIPLGVLPLTVGAAVIGVPLALGITSTLLIVIAGSVALFSPRLRRLE